jgi:lipopolysaccharide transport system ATP-binding protein
MAGGYLSLRERMVNALKFEKSNVEDFWALKDVSFEVQPGESIGIIGRNGAGKSTLLKILSKITPPTSGKIVSRGRIASLLEVGTGFHPELTGRENIFFNGSLLGMKRKEIETKFDEIVDFSGVEKFLDTPLKHFSSGMQLRLAFAVAAFLEPEILIIDEVLAVGDAEFQKKCLDKMKSVTHQGTTIIFVSHQLQTLSALTKNCMILDKGEVTFSGETIEGVKYYLKNDINTTNAVYHDDKNSCNKPFLKRAQVITDLNNGTQTNGKDICFEFIIFTPWAIKGACFSFQIVDDTNRNIVHKWIFDSDKPFCREKGEYKLSCKVTNLKLYMGEYYLKTFLSEPPGGEMYQALEGICHFSVVMLGSIRQFTYEPNACVYTEEGVWEIEKSN